MVKKLLPYLVYMGMCHAGYMSAEHTQRKLTQVAPTPSPVVFCQTSNMDLVETTSSLSLNIVRT